MGGTGTGLDEIFKRAETIFGKWLDYDLQRDALGLQGEVAQRQSEILASRYAPASYSTGGSGAMLGVVLIGALVVGGVILLRR